MWSLWWVTAAARAGCLSSADVASLDARLIEAEEAYAALDGERFGRALDDATLMLPCLSDIPSPGVAARYHRMDALRRYGAGETDDTSASLLAARVLDPSYLFPDSLLPADHELRQAYEQLGAEPGDTRHPPGPREGELVFDGVRTSRQPLERATLVQLVDGDRVLGTRLLHPGDALPPYDAKPRDRTRLLVGSAVALAASGAFYGLAWSTHAPFWDTSRPSKSGDLARYQAQSRTWTALSATSFGVGTVGVVLAFAWADDGKAPPGARW